MLPVGVKPRSLIFLGLLFRGFNRLLNTNLLHLDLFTYLMLLSDLLHNISLNMLLSVVPLRVELHPVLLFAHLHVLLIRHLLLHLLLFLKFHVHDELLLLPRIVNALVGSFLVDVELAESCLHTHHL